MSKEQLATTILITNNTSGPVGYTIPELKLHRLIQPNEEIEIVLEELLRLAFVPGGKEIFKLLTIGLNAQALSFLLELPINSISINDIIEESILITENTDNNNNNNNILVINDNNGTLDKTWQEIFDNFNNNVLCIIKYTSSEYNVEIGYIKRMGQGENSYTLYVDNKIYDCIQSTNYPVYNSNPTK